MAPRLSSLTLDPPVIFQLQLLTTWGDPYYVGMNGLEFYDQNDKKIPLSDNSILPTMLTTQTHTHTLRTTTAAIYTYTQWSLVSLDLTC